MATRNNPRTYLICLLFQLFFPRMCFPSNYTKTSIKGLIRYGNASGAVRKVQLLECKVGFKTIKQSHSIVVLKQKQQQLAFGTITWCLLFILIQESSFYSRNENSISGGPSHSPDYWSSPNQSIVHLLRPLVSYPQNQSRVLKQSLRLQF